MISGEYEGKKYDPQDLILAWEKHEESLNLEDTLPINEQEEEEEIQSPREPRREVFSSEIKILGNTFHFVRNFLFGLVFNFATIFYVLILKGVTIHSYYGAILGFLISHFIILLSLIIRFHHPVLEGYLSILLALVMLSFGYMVFSFLKKNRLGFLGSFIVGFFVGPLGPITTLFRSGLLPKEKSAIKFGFVSFILFSELFWYPYYAATQKSNIYIELTALTIFSICISSLIVLFHHHKRLPNTEQLTAGFFYQVSLFFIRGCIQQVREWKGVVFDLGLVVFAGGFLGIIFYDQPWQGPALDPFGIDNGCPSIIESINPSLCLLLSLPSYDPIPGQASLTCLALSLCAVASSLRIFGSEITQFRRESSSGTSAEAYYLGKSLAHIPIIGLAPFLFLLMFYSLGTVAAPFYLHYWLLFLVYFGASGIAYAVSVIAPASAAQLVGVLVILVNMTFSGFIEFFSFF